MLVIVENQDEKHIIGLSEVKGNRVTYIFLMCNHIFPQLLWAQDDLISDFSI